MYKCEIIHSGWSFAWIFTKERFKQVSSSHLPFWISFQEVVQNNLLKDSVHDFNLSKRPKTSNLVWPCTVLIQLDWPSACNGDHGAFFITAIYIWISGCLFLLFKIYRICNMYFDNFVVVDNFLLSFSISFAEIPFIGARRTLVDSSWHLSTFTALVPITNYVPV